MARSTFGGTAADYVITAASGGLMRLTAATLTFWDAPTGGNRHTDLLLAGSPVSSIVVGADGQIPAFEGPDLVTAMWADGGAGRARLVAEGKEGPVGPKGDAGAPGGSDAAFGGWLDDDLSETAAAARRRIAETDADAASTFRTQQDARLRDTYAGVLTATTGDQVARVQAYLDAASPIGAKRLVGTFTFGAPITVPANTYLDLSAATITHTVAAETAINLGSGCTVQGGRINSPATWDGANVTPTYAVIDVLGNGCTIDKVTLNNAPKVGIRAKDIDDTIVTGCHVYGNYPGAQWTGVETAHFGIDLEPSATASSGNFVVTGNFVKDCVQGVFTGPYGGGGPARGVTITGNTFEGCWNHGVYAYGDGVVISGNSFNRCQIPVATSGSYASITGNTIYTHVTTGTDERDLTGISCREAVGCVVANNTIRGIAPASAVIIDVRELSGVVCHSNIVEGNVVQVVGGTSAAIRVGAGGATTFHSNIIRNNVVRSVGIAGQGVIVVASAGTSGTGCDVSGNHVTMLGDSNGIYLLRQDHATVYDNRVRLEYDAPSAKTLGMVYLSSCTRTRVKGNDLHAPATWGANVNVRGTWEAGTCLRNRFEMNAHHYETGKIVSSMNMVLVSTSEPFLDEAGPGAPSSLPAVVGSRWMRTDGAAATTLYVKESGTGSTGWRAV